MYWMFLEPNKEFYIDTIFYDLPYVQSDNFDAKIRNLLLFCFFEICLFTFTDFRTRSLLSFAHAFEKYEHVIGWVWKVNKSHPIRFSETVLTSRHRLSRLSLSQKIKNLQQILKKFSLVSCDMFKIFKDLRPDINISHLKIEVCELEDGGCVERHPFVFDNVCRFFGQGKWIIWFYFPL